jgi:hypothetical protein
MEVSGTQAEWTDPVSSNYAQGFAIISDMAIDDDGDGYSNFRE